jgi:hypothetical protein
MVFMVEDWLNKKRLAKLGFLFDPRELTDFEVSCYSIIENKMNDLEMDELERQNKIQG